MIRYYLKRPEFFVFQYDEEEILPKEVRNKLNSYGYIYAVESTPVSDTSVVRRAILTHVSSVNGQTLPPFKEIRVDAGEYVMFVEDTKTVTKISLTRLSDIYEEAPITEV